MKLSVSFLIFAIICCVCSRPVYAFNPRAFIFKTCSVCEGHGGTIGWYGNRVPCEKCGGDGKVFSIWGTIFVAAVAIYASKMFRK